MLELKISRLPFRMQRFLTSLALILALGLSANSATAVGFGKVVSATTLGQPLSLVIALRLEPGDSIESACAKAEVSFGDRQLPEAMVRSRVETSPTTGERRVRVSTTVPVDEPVVGINLSLGCPLSMSRSFVVFADPPVRGAQAATAESSQDSAWVTEGARSPVAGVLAAVPQTAARPASAPTAPGAGKRRNASAALPERPERADLAASPRLAAPDASTGTRRAARAARPPKPSGGPVLRLDPVEADALISPSLQMATSLSQMPDPAASGVVPRFIDPEQEQRFREQERLKAMEAALVKLRSDSQSTEKSLNEMQVRVRAAEAGRYANPLVYLLATLCALLAAGLAGMWWLRRRDRRAAAWWTPPAEAGLAPAPAAAEASTFLPETAPVPPPVLTQRVETVRAEPAAAPSRSSLPMASRPMGLAAETDASVVEPRRPMSAEELIDLEQQAEFFVVLGQDDAAIDLLMGHVRSTGGVSPLPYLKLLDIYRRRGEREPYDRIRERFNRRFNAYAPEWGVDAELGLSLEGYPEVMSRLQGAWATPSRAMELLDASLFRRDAGPTFDVPAYRELLFLYGIARDLAERDVSPDGVDLLLPLNEEPVPTLTTVSATPPAPPEPSVMEHFSLDLDVSTDQPPHLTLEHPDFKRSSH